MWFVYTIISNSHIKVSLVVAGGLAPILCQDICHHHDDVGWATRLYAAQHDAKIQVQKFEIVLVMKLGYSSVRQYKLMVG